PAQSIDLIQDHARRPPAIVIAEIVLGAEGAAIRTAARGFDLGARANRLGFEAMVVMMVSAHHLVGPCEGRLVREGHRLRTTDRADGPGILETETCKLPLAIRQPQDRLLAFAHDDDVDRELSE